MSYQERATNAVNNLFIWLTRADYLETASPEQLAQLERITPVFETVWEMLSDPPGPGPINCLELPAGGGLLQAAALLPGCQAYLTRLHGYLRQIVAEVAELFPADETAQGLAEVVAAAADEITNWEETSRETVNVIPGCGVLIEYPFGFGTNCEPKIPLWLLLGVGAYIGLKVFS